MSYMSAFVFLGICVLAPVAVSAAATKECYEITNRTECQATNCTSMNKACRFIPTVAYSPTGTCMCPYASCGEITNEVECSAANCPEFSFPAQFKCSWTASSTTCDCPSGRSIGDPHVRTLDGMVVTYVRSGDHLMLATTGDSPSPDFSYQARFCIVGTDVASSTCGVALKCSKDAPLVEVYAEGRDGGVYVNGKAVKLPISGQLAVRDAEIRRKDTQYELACTMGVHIMVRVQTAVDFTYLDTSASAPSKLGGHVRGLLGNLDGNAENDVAFQDGTVWNPGHGLDYVNGMEFPDLDELQKSWELSREDSLFLRPFEQKSSPSRRRQALAFKAADFALRSAATEHCEKHDITGALLEMCIFDYMASGGDCTFASNTAVGFNFGHH